MLYCKYCEIFRVKMTSLSVKNNYKLKNEKIVLWISQRCLRISYLIGISKAAHTGQYSENIIIDREDVDSASISGG